MPGQPSEETLHQALEAYARGEADELAVAEAMGLDLSTEKAKLGAIQSVRNMSGVSAKANSMESRVSTFRGVTKLHGDGRTQVPRAIRDVLGLVDGDYVFWYEVGGLYVLSPREMNTDWMRGNLTYAATKPKASMPRQKF